MIRAHLAHALWLLAVLVSYRYLLKRHFATDEHVRLALTLSAASLTLASLVSWLGAFADYPRWFLPSVYPILEWSVIGLTAVGALLFVRALALREPERDATLSAPVDQDRSPAPSESGSWLAAEELRAALAQPYPFVESAGLALQRMLARVRLTAGAIFVYNESAGVMTLIAASGLEPADEAAVERLSLQQPALSEALASGGVALTQDFRAASGALQVGSSALVAPFLSGDTPLGCAVLFAATPVELTAVQRRTLRSLSSVIAEKFQVTKLRGDVRRERQRSERALERVDRWLERVNLINAATAALDEADAAAQICAALVGIGGAEHAALARVTGDALTCEILGRSSASAEPSDGLLRATAQALRQRSPSLLTRRAGEGEDARERIGLALSLNTADGDTGVVLWSDSGRFRLESADWRRLQALTQSADTALRSVRLRATEQPGLRALEVAHELFSRAAAASSFTEALDAFARVVEKALPERRALIVFALEPRGRLRPVVSSGVELEALQDLVVLPGEGSLGRAAALGAESVELGGDRLRELCDEYDMMNRDIFGDGFALFGAPRAELIFPLTINGRPAYAVALYLADSAGVGAAAQTMRLLVALQSLTMTTLELRALSVSGSATDPSGAARLRRLGLLINSVNNDLSAIVGNCQLAGHDANLTGEIERALRVIQERAESAAARLRAEMDTATAEQGRSQGDGTVATADESGSSLCAALLEFADQTLVGGDILLTDDKARELSFDLSADVRAALSEAECAELAGALCRKFGALADERERVSVVSYATAEFQCVDFSRHRQNFPALRGAIEFARYAPPADEFFGLPATLCARLRAVGVEVALDERSDPPAFISLRAPGSPAGAVEYTGAEEESVSAHPASAPAAPEPLRILAIDDQSMILDLLQAMCQSMGYEIAVDTSPRAALELFARERFDIVISDISMPELDGWAVAREVKTQRPETHILFITGWGEGVTEQQLGDAGVDQILYKPFRLEQLAEALDRARAQLTSIEDR